MADISARKRGDKWYYSFEAAQVDGKSWWKNKKGSLRKRHTSVE